MGISPTKFLHQMIIDLLGAWSLNIEQHTLESSQGLPLPRMQRDPGVVSWPGAKIASSVAHPLARSHLRRIGFIFIRLQKLLLSHATPELLETISQRRPTLRTKFAPDHDTHESRTVPSPIWQLGLSLQAFSKRPKTTLLRKQQHKYNNNRHDTNERSSFHRRNM